MPVVAHATSPASRARSAPRAPRRGVRTLAIFPAGDGSIRAVCALAALDGSLLVVDRRRDDGRDARLVARLEPGEPQINADLVCRQYLDHPRACRALTDADLSGAPSCAADDPALNIGLVLTARDGTRFRISVTPRPAAELRWLCCPPDGPERVVSLRRVIGTLEDYEPARALSLAAVARHRRDPTVATTTLAIELRRLGTSPTVLNRLLREAVLEANRSDGLSLSSIALRCGRVKRDRRGNVTGETSWLARRIGILADAGCHAPTPWVHADVLALIARCGLCIDPREVELG